MQCLTSPTQCQCHPIKPFCSTNRYNHTHHSIGHCIAAHPKSISNWHPSNNTWCCWQMSFRVCSLADAGCCYRLGRQLGYRFPLAPKRSTTIWANQPDALSSDWILLFLLLLCRRDTMLSDKFHSIRWIGWWWKFRNVRHRSGCVSANSWNIHPKGWLWSRIVFVLPAELLCSN